VPKPSVTTNFDIWRESMQKKWWKESVVYQIYPRSFVDSNGDGIGDIPGIISKLDYLKDMGITVLWVGPVYKSPNRDNGYDISNFHEIMSEFGTMDDWEILIKEAHNREIKIIMDMVINHTSNEHPWFIESKTSVHSPYREYYIWRKGNESQEPNNWKSVFGGSIWEYDETSEEYYLHIFTKEQPDLNWDNPALRDEMYKMMLWWLDKGVDGFRFDAISHLKKADGLPDAENPYNERYVSAWNCIANQGGLMDFLLEMKSKLYPDREIMTIGEMSAVSAEDALKYVDEWNGVFSMIVQFDHMGIDKAPEGKWKRKSWNLLELKYVMNKWQKAIGDTGWISLYLESHDHARSVSTLGQDGVYHKESAQMLATFYQLMRGTPFIYQGQEIGMTNVKFDSIHDYNDVEIHNFYNESLQSGKSEQEIFEEIWSTGRDNARTPMQWDDGPNAGFTQGTPWIKVNDNYKTINVKQQITDESSIYAYYKKLISLRKELSVIVYGDCELILRDHMDIYAYTRTMNNQSLIVICNFFGAEPFFELPHEYRNRSYELLLSNYPVEDININNFIMKPYEARVYLVN
jgi:oligo-1,6-glucosidase